MSHTRRLLVAPLLLASFLIALPAPGAAAERRSEGQPVHFSLLRIFLPAWRAALSFWEKEGSSIDPYGNPKPNAVAPVPGSNGTPPAQSNPGSTS
jgi:hypothetical protein